MKSVRRQLLVTLVATAIAAGFFIHHGLPPSRNVVYAIVKGDVDQVRRFAAWCPPSEPYFGDASPLHFAVLKGDEKMVALLAQRREYLYSVAGNIEVFHGMPMTLAILKGCRFIEVFHGTPMTLAILKGCRFVEILLDAGFDPNHATGAPSWMMIGPFECTYLPDALPLYVAVCQGRLEIVKLLLSRGADVNAKDNKGRTPLYWARKHEDVADLLRQHGATE